MKKVLSINTVNYGSTGNIMRGISKIAEEKGFVCWQAYAPDKKNFPQQERDIIISSYNVRRINELYARYTGMRGFQAFISTKLFLEKIDKIKPDIIHLHNLHNNYIHVGLLFDYIKKKHIKVIWTLHDCWAFTGRCPYFQVSGCARWQSGCYDCPYPKDEYPSVRVDKSDILWRRKKVAFTGVDNMTIVTPSEWLAGLVKESFLAEYPIKVINNGIDLNIFKPTQSDFRQKHHLGESKLLLGISAEWNYYKGLDIFIELSKLISGSKYRIVLVGVNKELRRVLPNSILALDKICEKKRLAEIYTACDYFVNPSREETYPTVNCESVACGTPVVTFHTGGSQEAMKGYGVVTQRKTAEAIFDCVKQLEIVKFFPIIDLKSYDKDWLFEKYMETYK